MTGARKKEHGRGLSAEPGRRQGTLWGLWEDGWEEEQERVWGYRRGCGVQERVGVQEWVPEGVLRARRRRGSKYR